VTHEHDAVAYRGGSKHLMADHLQVARAVLERWKEQGRPITGALIQGSVAQYGYVTPGSDIDLCIVVQGTPDHAWFEERESVS
jgi:predicted nucleotidyltransferase